MGQLKELHIAGQELQQELSAVPVSIPTFEQLREMQERYIDILRICQHEPPIRSHENDISGAV